jgi:hypothetical protein
MGFDLIKHCLQGIQLCVAVRSPNPPKYGQDHGAVGQNVSRRDGLTMLIGKGKGGHGVAHFDGAIHNSASAEFGGGLTHHSTDISGHAHRRSGFQGR